MELGRWSIDGYFGLGLAMVFVREGVVAIRDSTVRVIETD